MKRKVVSNVVEKDLTCLGEDAVFPSDFAETGINENELVIGGTGSGKTTSIAVPTILHTHNKSMVVPLAKRRLIKQVAGVMKKRGYRVEILDFAHPQESSIRYDPMDNVQTEEDEAKLAQAMVELSYGNKDMVRIDPFWTENSKNMILATIKLERLNAKEADRRASLVNVLELLDKYEWQDGNDEVGASNLDCLFEAAQEKYPDSRILSLWKSAAHNPPRTAACIVSTVRACVGKLYSKNLFDLMSKPEYMPIEQLGSEKVILFVVTSATNESMISIANLLYADIFYRLMEVAEGKETQRLDVPVHVILDDAAASRISGLETYISMFRAAGVSITIMLQSMKQLELLYTTSGMVTIQDNCDTTVYLSISPHDPKTADNISARINKPVCEIMNMPLEHCFIIRRGAPAIYTKRYKTFEDPLFVEGVVNNLKERV